MFAVFVEISAPNELRFHKHSLCSILGAGVSTDVHPLQDTKQAGNEITTRTEKAGTQFEK
jgi:hypothetical protein